MSLVDKLDDIARTNADSRRAEIERLLAQNTGRLLRASDLQPARRKTGSREAWENFAAAGERFGRDSRSFLRFTSSVSLNGTHPRGYRFSYPGLCEAPALSLITQSLQLFGSEEFRDIPLQRVGFLDTETTGAMGPTGTLPFMIGVGFLQCDGAGSPAHFVCEQYFVEDFCGEPALMEFLCERLAAFDAFVTFNGKSFDVPLLRARFILNRVRVDLDRPHLDLLHAVRRIWKLRIGGCSLGAVEQQILALSRTHDVESRLIPQIYFDYLRGVHPERLIPIFDHNAQDVISMGALVLLLAECAHDPAHCAVAACEDLIGLGRLHGARGASNLACAFLEAATLLGRDANSTNLALRELARLYRKTGRPAEAAGIWEQECRRSGVRNRSAIIELLKLYEHQLKDYTSALSWIDRAEREIGLGNDIASFTATRAPGENRDFSIDLGKRRARILKKVKPDILDAVAE